MIITDFLDPALDIYARRSEVQLLNREHPEEGLLIAESPLVIERALQAGYTPVSVLCETKEEAKAAALAPGVPVYTADFAVLKHLTGFPLTRGMLCAMRRKPLPTLEAVCKNACRVAVLEEVVNPTNVGAIIRSAAALGMDAVVLSQNCADPLYRRAIRVSMGTVFRIPWTIEEGDYLEKLHSLGFATAAMALTDRSVPIDHAPVSREPRLAVLLGSEGPGLKESTIERATYTVKIPMAYGVDSLNVAAASAVAFWQLGRK